MTPAEAEAQFIALWNQGLKRPRAPSACSSAG